MTRQFTITSALFTGKITLAYDANGILSGFYNEAVLSPGQLEFLSKKFPMTLEILDQIQANSKNMTVTDTTIIPTFEMFWDAYGYKINKADTIRHYDKLLADDKIKVMTCLPGYAHYLMLRPNMERQHPNTFISKRTFDNDYAALVKK